ncbi:glycoside hydrolase family 36 protein [Ruminococcus albus]|uniref:Alpha-galactosidase n=1 Tax=Ruminococcus albus TaxID=1264 RepID=A0A1H7KH50_RUMAL|nr:glycoside hydrolase family 36 protein [Ruminococcus albus]SEK85854.1 alpha-galactosidase [Ruminococcus albus]
MKRIQIFENGINVVFEITDEKMVKLLHFSALPFDESTMTSRTGNAGFSLVELQISGIDRPGERHGNKYIITAPGYRLEYKDFKDTNNSLGRKLEIICFDEETGLETVSHMQFYTGARVVRTWTDVNNCGTENWTLEYVSSFSLTGIEKEGLLPQDDKMRVGICHNSWQRELQWQFYSLEQAGLGQSQPTEWQHSSKVLGVTNVGNWSSKEYIPMGYVENTEVGGAMMWQIEHNGSWHWEISDREGHLYLQLSGPSEIESHWSKILKPGESFRSVYCGVCAVNGGFDEAVAEMTRYRRLIRRKNHDNAKLPVIFNDYMNCLWADPTTEKELPLIDAAAEVGCEYFCIDAGWYADDVWWDWVGEWQESRKRFPNGLREVTDYIRKKGMIPGVWLEIEVMGIKCPMADKLPDEWFFVRHGKRVFDRSRYQLDFRVPAVRDHCDAVVDRLINKYGVGYIKMDYNIEPGIGTENDADSFGDGLLEHERAYLAWLDGVFKRHPKLIVENCSSGGLRMDYALLSRCSIQSTSDQDDYRRYATIAANAPSAVCPEQAAVWSYPLETGDWEEVVFNMVNAMLLRVHQSGHLARLETERKALVKEGIDVYKSIRGDIANGVPFYPLRLSKFSDNWSALGLRCDGRIYLAVWHREGSGNCVIPIKSDFNDVKVSCIYPSYNEEKFAYNPNNRTLSLRFSRPNMARLFVLEEQS